MSLDEIAEFDGVGQETIKGSIKAVEAYRSKFGIDSMQRSQMETVINAQPLEAIAISEGLKATKTVMQGDKAITVPDHSARNDTIRSINQKVSNLQPKGKSSVATQVNVGIGVQSQPSPGQSGGAFSYEDRLRAVQQKRSQLTEGAIEEEERKQEEEKAADDATEVEAVDVAD